MAVRISTEIDTALVTWIKNVFSPDLDGKIIWDKASLQGARVADKPPLPYVSLNVISGPTSQTGADFKKADPPVVGEYNMFIIKAFTLSIKYIDNEDFLAKIEELADSLENPIHQQQLRDDADLGVWEIFDTTDVSEQLTTKFQGTGQMDVRFSYAKKIPGVVLGQIDEVEIEPTIDGTTGNIFTVDVNNP